MQRWEKGGIHDQGFLTLNGCVPLGRLFVCSSKFEGNRSNLWRRLNPELEVSSPGIPAGYNPARLQRTDRWKALRL